MPQTFFVHQPNSWKLFRLNIIHDALDSFIAKLTKFSREPWRHHNAKWHLYTHNYHGIILSRLPIRLMDLDSRLKCVTFFSGWLGGIIYDSAYIISTVIAGPWLSSTNLFLFSSKERSVLIYMTKTNNAWRRWAKLKVYLRHLIGYFR